MARVAPIGVELTSDLGFEPDALYLAPGQEGLRRRRGIKGAPAIIVEVLSPSTRNYVLRQKLPAYLSHGVREVWVIDPVNETVTVHVPSGEPRTCRFGERIPSDIVDVGTADLENLPELAED